MKLYLALMLMFLTALFYVWTRHQAVQMGYEISKLNREIKQKREEQGSLKVEMKHQTSLHRIERRAKLEWGFVEPAPGQVLVWDYKP